MAADLGGFAGLAVDVYSLAGLDRRVDEGRRGIEMILDWCVVLVLRQVSLLIISFYVCVWRERQCEMAVGRWVGGKGE